MSGAMEKGIVSSHPGILNGDLIFTGTRVPVNNLIDHLEAGNSLDGFLEGFPGVSREHAVRYLEMAHESAEPGDG